MSWLEDTDMISCTKDGHQMPPRDPFPAYPGLSAASATPSTPQIFTIDSRRTKILGLALAHDEKEVFWLTVEVSSLLSFIHCFGWFLLYLVRSNFFVIVFFLLTH